MPPLKLSSSVPSGCAVPRTAICCMLCSPKHLDSINTERMCVQHTACHVIARGGGPACRQGHGRHWPSGRAHRAFQVPSALSSTLPLTPRLRPASHAWARPN
jgi:hypothetical protein